MRAPFIAQMALEDCGPACLAMVLAAHGHYVPLAEVKDRCGAGRSGTTAYDLIMAARSFSLEGEGMARVEPREVREFLKDGPVILHWGLGHMVVCDHASTRGLRILDPAKGTFEVGWGDLDKALSGVVLTFRPGQGFTPRASQARPIRRLLQELLRDRLPVIALASAGLVAQALTVLPALAVGLAVDAGAGSPGRAGIAGMSGLALASLIGGLLDLYRNLLASQLAAAANERFYSRVLHRLLELPLSWIQARGAGEIQARLTQIQGVLGSAATALVGGSTAAGSAAGCFLALVWLAPEAALYALLASLAVIVLTRRIAERERIRARPYLLLTARIGSEASEVIRARSWIEMAGLGSWASAKLLRLIEAWRDHVLAATHQSRLASFQIGLLKALADGGLLFVAGAMGVAGRATLGEVAMIVALGAVLRGALTGLADAVRALYGVGNTMDRSDDILEAEGEPRGTHEGRIDGLVEARDLTFSYWPGADAVLKGIDLRIEAGEMVGLVGPSGCGKSTLGALIAGVRLPSTGELRVSGIAIRAWKEESLRQQVGYALQIPEVLAGSVRLNLDLGRHASDEELWATLHQACLDEVVRRLGGLDAKLDTGGRNLSGGERQRLALARALVGRPRILVLDEATSALDLPLEAEIHRNLRALAMTRLLITHRRGSLDHADRVLEMSGGRLG